MNEIVGLEIYLNLKIIKQTSDIYYHNIIIILSCIIKYAHENYI